MIIGFLIVAIVYLMAFWVVLSLIKTLFKAYESSKTKTINDEEIELDGEINLINISENTALISRRVEGKENTFSFTPATIDGNTIIHGISTEVKIESREEVKIKFLNRNTFQITYGVEGKQNVVALIRATIVGDVITYDETIEIDKEKLDE